MTRFCPSCNTGNVASARFCRGCGSFLAVAETANEASPEFCAHCDAALLPGQQFCGHCGASAEQSGSPAPMAVDATPPVAADVTAQVPPERQVSATAPRTNATPEIAPPPPDAWWPFPAAGAAIPPAISGGDAPSPMPIPPSPEAASGEPDSAPATAFEAETAAKTAPPAASAAPAWRIQPVTMPASATDMEARDPLPEREATRAELPAGQYERQQDAPPRRKRRMVPVVCAVLLVAIGVETSFQWYGQHKTPLARHPVAGAPRRLASSTPAQAQLSAPRPPIALPAQPPVAAPAVTAAPVVQAPANRAAAAPAAVALPSAVTYSAPRPPVAPAPSAAMVPAAPQPSGLEMKSTAVAVRAKPAPAVQETGGGAAARAAKTDHGRTAPGRMALTKRHLARQHARAKPDHPVAGSRPTADSAGTAVGGAVRINLDTATRCMAAKRYDCAIASARAVLSLAPDNVKAAGIVRQAKTEQEKAMRSIQIQ